MSFKTKKLEKLMLADEIKAIEFERALLKANDIHMDDELEYTYIRVPRSFEFEMEPVEGKPAYWRNWWTGRYYVPLMVYVAENGRVWATLRTTFYDR